MTPEPFSAKTREQPKQQASLSPTLKALFATGALITIVIGGMALNGLPVPFLPHHGDELTEAQVRDRLAAFKALAPVPLVVIADHDVPAAIESMHLAPDAKQALQAAASPASDPAKQTVRLAWITLWDTDVEDGDTVRVDSGGYSRTVVLTKEPVTFAVPVPASGTVTITGIRDGDGGGITVGLASGPVKAVFPIMSEGQTLGLRVKVN